MKLYAVIRIPKSGSRSLGVMVEKSLPSSHHFRIPQLSVDSPERLHPAEKFRARRRLLQGLLKYRALNAEMVWKNVSRRARDGDIISGHMPYGMPQLPGWELLYITLLRDPIDRVVSEYYYSRKGYLSRPHWRRLYHKGHAEIAGTKSFPDYVRYLCDHRPRFSNPALKFVTGGDDHQDPLSFLKEHYFHFGILERMDLFARQLAQKLDAPECQVWENKSDVMGKYMPTDAELDLLHSLLDKDIVFYQETRQYILGI
ncbi:MAG: sulfotransferase family protein [Desulfofustis sp.]|nr:sulfotransferase family protein [Desulfofustis sp.]MBT8354841.1 sulfotransferase family protein [Desulfofustis sp.]NNK58109.1 sulfotransferase family 2 domain-containing protein [Desulfofustis sp.]RZW26364.1 MAG: hypothetical protein EX260_01355 [Desulfobulbaceae bacterium]